MIVCKTCRIPFEEGAQFCNSCGGFVDYVGVSEGSDGAGPSASPSAATAPGAGGGATTPRADTTQMAIAASAATDAKQRAVAEAEAQERHEAEALARAATAGAAETEARAAAAATADSEDKAAAEAEARAQATAKAKAEAEAAEAARAAEASRRAAAMIAKPAPTPRRPEAPASPQPAATAPAEPKAPAAPKPATAPAPELEAGETPCPQCSAGNPASRNFCRKCGAPLTQAAPVPVAAAPRKRGAFASRLKVPLVVGIVAGLAVGAYFLTRDDNGGGPGTGGGPDTTEETAPEPTRPREVLEQVTVDATRTYVDTGVELEVGDHVEIVARGQAESGGGPSGPEGDPNPNYRGANVIDGGHNGLIAKIGVRGDPFFVGPRLVFDAEEAGTLLLGVNDVGVDNNSGAYVAEITVT